MGDDGKVVVYTAVLGALAAGLAPLLYRFSQSSASPPSLASLRQGLEAAQKEWSEGVSRGAEIWIREAKDAIMTREMQDALATVSYLLENVKKFDMEAKNYDGFGFLLLALVKKAHDSADQEQELPDQEVLAKEQLEAARRIGQFAINVYPASWRLSLPSIGKSLGVPEQDIVLVHFSDLPDQGHCPKFALFLDHASRSLVLAVRGTFSLKDVVLDIVCEEAAFLTGQAHSGILQGAARVLERVGLLLTSTLRLHPGYSLTLTGHSLGAGTASLLCMDLLHGQAAALLPPGTRVKCVALAPPPVWREGRRGTPPQVTQAIEIYINNCDIVPRLSLASVAQLLASLRAVDSLGLSLVEQFSVLTGGEGAALARVVAAVRGAGQDTFPYLQHPGRIYYLKRSSKREKLRMVFRQESASFSRAIFLLDNMVLDHLQPSYEEALNNICTNGENCDHEADMEKEKTKSVREDLAVDDCYSDNE